MLRATRSLIVAAPLLAVALPARAQFSSTTTNRLDTDCRGLKLVAAKGVPTGESHSYRFHGICKLLSVSSSADKVGGITYDTDKDAKQVGQVWAEVEARWDSKTGQFEEAIAVQGDRTGKIKMTLRCAQDPVVTSVGCVRGEYANATGWAGFDGAWNQARPISRGQTTLKEAAEASAKAAAAPPPTPPPPPKPQAGAAPPEKKMSQPAGPDYVVEGERLIRSALATSNQPAPAVQDMTQFGKQWSGDAQLFWAAGLVGAQLRLTVSFAGPPGRYEVYLGFTQAPDYGLIEASFHGHPPIHFNGYAKTVVRNRGALGMFDLKPGRYELLLSIAGKDGMSSGYFVGVDRVEFVKR